MSTVPTAPTSRTRKPAVCLVSLGCSKNLVDSEVMVGHLGRAGIELVSDVAESDVAIVNTCGFIGDAREESIDAILELAQAKRRGELAGVVVTGCLVELHASQLAREIPEVDAFLPLSDYSGVPSIVRSILAPDRGGPCPEGEARQTWVPGAQGSADVRPGGHSKVPDSDLGRSLLTPVHTAYLRLGEGCNHVCAFCAIPHIRGKLKSKPRDVLVEEASALASLGTRELTLIAEDSTDWGKDLGTGERLADLLEALGEVDGLAWVRVMYAHPATMDERLIDVMAATPNVVPYLDMPIQHGDDAVLAAMRRGSTAARIRELVLRLRAAMPDVTLRTTTLVGFPGETEDAFARLLELLGELRFDRLGCFAWSPEEGTEAHGLPGSVDPELAAERRDLVMRRQREIMAAANQRAIGTTVELLIDSVGAGGAVGRRAIDAPEVDGAVHVAHGEGRADCPAEAWAPLEPGDFVTVRITGRQGYDLTATLEP